MVRYFAAAATATVLDHSLRRSRDHIGIEIICVTGFASGDGTGLVSRSTTSSAVVGEPGYAQRDASHVVEAGARRSAKAHTGSPPKANNASLPAGVRSAAPPAIYRTNEFAVRRRPGFLVNPFRLFDEDSPAA